MAVNILESSDVIQLGKLLRVLVETFEDLFKMLYVLEYKSLCLVQYYILDTGKEISIG